MKNREKSKLNGLYQNTKEYVFYLAAYGVFSETDTKQISTKKYFKNSMTRQCLIRKQYNLKPAANESLLII